jgi:hypothetical protein
LSHNSKNNVTVAIFHWKQQKRSRLKCVIFPVSAILVPFLVIPSTWLRYQNTIICNNRPIKQIFIVQTCRARRSRDRMLVGFTTIYALSAYHHWCCEFESRSGQGVQQYVINFVSDLRQVGGFLQVLRFPPPIKLTSTI